MKWRLMRHRVTELCLGALDINMYIQTVYNSTQPFLVYNVLKKAPTMQSLTCGNVDLWIRFFKMHFMFSIA